MSLQPTHKILELLCGPRVLHSNVFADPVAGVRSFFNKVQHGCYCLLAVLMLSPVSQAASSAVVDGESHARCYALDAVLCTQPGQLPHP